MNPPLLLPPNILPRTTSALPSLIRCWLVSSLVSVAFLGMSANAHAQYNNTGYGNAALDDVTTGDYNSAFGAYALGNDRDGSNNSAVGYATLNGNFTGSGNTAVGFSALSFNNASDNTAVGYYALNYNGSGTQNTATGVRALRGVFDNVNGSYNTATGFEALYNIYDDIGNVANGWQALYSNTSGIYNTASGASALRQNTSGSRNTATGINALYYNNGQNNSAYGAESLQNNSTGNNNTAVGYDALFYNNTGSNNIAIGFQAGLNTTGSNNIAIGHAGVASESGRIRIGTAGKQTDTLIAGIYGRTIASGAQVIIGSGGKLGTIQSSARYKEAIRPMKQVSEALLQLEPVTFRYKEDLDPDGVPQFGLIAEQVEKIDPSLVVRDEEGKVSTVRYEAINAMLLNEFLKGHRKVQSLETTVAKQQKQIAALTAGLQKVNARVESRKPAARVVASD